MTSWKDVFINSFFACLCQSVMFEQNDSLCTEHNDEHLPAECLWFCSVTSVRSYKMNPPLGINEALYNHEVYSFSVFTL